MVNGKPLEESALPAEAARSGESARYAIWRKIAARLAREIPADTAGLFPGERGAGRPPQQSRRIPKVGLPPLAVYNPIHYQELPELFMDFICSLTGKSPSTTGFGSEGALTKGPFNALLAGGGSEQRAGLVRSSPATRASPRRRATSGRNIRVDHDISMLVPEIWCRMRVHERDPQFLIANGYLEKVERFRLRRPHGARQPPGLSHHVAVRRPLPGPHL